MTQYGHNLVGHIVDVPEIALQCVGQNFTHATGAANQHRYTVAKRLKRRNTKRFAHAWHDIQIRHCEYFWNVLAAQEAGEQNLVSNSHGRRHFNHALRLVAVAGHNKLHAVHDIKHALGRADEILRTLLHGNSPEIQHNFIAALDGLRAHASGIKIHAVVDHVHFVGVHAVAIHHQVAREHAHGDHAHRAVHSAALNVVQRLIHVLAGAIKLRAVHMHNKGLACRARNGKTRRIRQPIMRVDYIKVNSARGLQTEARVLLALLN